MDPRIWLCSALHHCRYVRSDIMHFSNILTNNSLANEKESVRVRSGVMFRGDPILNGWL